LQKRPAVLLACRFFWASFLAGRQLGVATDSSVPTPPRVGDNCFPRVGEVLSEGAEGFAGRLESYNDG